MQDHRTNDKVIKKLIAARRLCMESRDEMCSGWKLVDEAIIEYLNQQHKKRKTDE